MSVYVLLSILTVFIFVCSRSMMQRGRYSTLLMVMIPVSPAGWGTSAVPDTVESRTWWLYSTGKNKFITQAHIWWVLVIQKWQKKCLPLYNKCVKNTCTICQYHVQPRRMMVMDCYRDTWCKTIFSEHIKQLSKH